MGKKGGASKSPAKLEAIKRNLALAQKVRRRRPDIKPESLKRRHYRDKIKYQQLAQKHAAWRKREEKDNDV
jgi:hypothetical protein